MNNIKVVNNIIDFSERLLWRPARRVLATCGIAAVISMAITQPSAAENLKVGLVLFFTGSASASIGLPARNAAKVVIDAINAGTVGGTYANSGKGVGGLQIEPIYSDEGIPTADRVTEYRNMIQRQGADVVIGYVSSGSCLAIAPVAEELKTLTLFYGCGSTRVFEEADRKYVFRTMTSQDVENIAAARYILDLKPDLKVVSGMNQNYAWGQDSWRDFLASLQQLKPDAKVGTEQFPKIFAGQYGAEVTALMRADADVVHSSFWGGDMEAFILQGSARGLFDDQTVILTTGGAVIYNLTNQIPEGTVIGARGTGDIFAPKSKLNDWFRAAYKKEFGKPPIFTAYIMAQSLLGLKAAADKAANDKGGTPSADDIRAALTGLTFDSPAGPVEMARANGHQAITDIGYGTFALVDGKPTVRNVKIYKAACVNPPVGIKSLEWIKAGFPGAKCD